MIAGPLLAAMYITNLLVARLYLGEVLTSKEWLGLILIIAGVVSLGVAGGAG